VIIMAIKKRKHPKFLRPNYGRSSRSRIKIAWRRPRGIDNKKRLKIKYMGASPSIGYRQPNAIRYFHPKGKPEVLVQTPAGREGLKDGVSRIAGGVGRLKRAAIEKLAAAKGLHVLFIKKYPEKVKRVKKDKSKKAEPEKKVAPAPAAEAKMSPAGDKSPAAQAKKEAAPAANPTAQSSAKLASQAVSHSHSSQKSHEKNI